MSSESATVHDDLRNVREMVRWVRRLRTRDQPDGRETLLQKVRRWQRLRMPELPLRQVAHRDRWAELFEEMRQDLLAAWPEADLTQGLRIEHIGSSAVPTLPSKEIIDLAIGAARAQPFEPRFAALERNGFEPYGQAPGSPDVLWFWKLDHPECAFVVHLCQLDDPWWQNALVFRDFLRAHPAEARRYEEHKIELAAAEDTNPLAYSLGKIELLLEINRLAQEWQTKRESRWV